MVYRVSTILYICIIHQHFKRCPSYLIRQIDPMSAWVITHDCRWTQIGPHIAAATAETLSHHLGNGVERAQSANGG